MSRCKLSLGNERFVQVLEWQGELIVDPRERNNDRPTTKSISLNLMQYKNLTAAIEFNIDPVYMKSSEDENIHLGRNIFVKWSRGNPCVDIRKYWKPENALDTVPTEKGLFLRPVEYTQFKDLFAEIDKIVPELSDAIPCLVQDDHMNQLGMLRCKNCNPDHYTDWTTFRGQRPPNIVKASFEEANMQHQLAMLRVENKLQELEERIKLPQQGRLIFRPKKS